ncbi:MAG: AGE family epimerase/isomerase, partial [Alphaproteobacteria bacterium]
MPSPPIIDAGKVLPRLERLLADVVVPYWFPDKVDPTGGYNLNHGNDGGWLGPADKLVVTQVRMLLAAARLLRERDVLPDGIDVGDLRAAADHGFAFLRDRMWDPEHDGVFWSVDSDGAPRESSKHLLAQADALAALAEYARATGSDAAADLAGRLFARIEQARDRRFGGYHEQHSRDWTPIGEGGRKLVGIGAHR